jgi:RND family efflux transporter MFP subunit
MSIAAALKGRITYVVLGVALVGVSLYELAQPRAPQAIANASAAPRPEPHRVIAEGHVVTYPGGEVTVSAELAGKITELTLKERDRVAAGDVLARLDVELQRAALNEASLRAKEAQTDLDFFRHERQRNELLFDEKAVTEAARDRAVHDVRAAEARRASLLAAATRIRTLVDKATLRAPRAGVVTARLVDPGEMVREGDPILTLADLDQVRIEAEVGEFDVSAVRLGGKASIRVEGEARRTFAGRIEEIPDVVVPRRLRPMDPANPVDTRVLLVKIAPEEHLPLKLGQRVEVELDP